MNIKEIALKISHEMQLATELVMGDYNEGVTDFAEALVAELAKGNEPVAWCVAYDDPRMGRIHSNPTMYKPEAEELAKRATSDLVVCDLFTTPPTASQIEQETAEAIAKYLRVIGIIGYEGAAFKGIVSGAWKEFKKS